MHKFNEMDSKVTLIQQMGCYNARKRPDGNWEAIEYAQWWFVTARIRELFSGRRAAQLNLIGHRGRSGSGLVPSVFGHTSSWR
jgi:hypothetical protein